MQRRDEHEALIRCTIDTVLNIRHSGGAGRTPWVFWILGVFKYFVFVGKKTTGKSLLQFDIASLTQP